MTSKSQCLMIFGGLAITFSLVAACGGSDEGPSEPGPGEQTGLVQVSTNTTGEDLDPDGYTVGMAGLASRSIGVNGVVTFTDVAAGSHQVELTGLSDNCSVSGDNPAAATVVGGETTPVSFVVSCEALPIGNLEIATAVTNNFDPDGYQVYVDGRIVGIVDPGGTVTEESVPAGLREIELRDIAPNCGVEGDNPATVAVPAGGSVTHTFSVGCSSPPDGRIVLIDTVRGRDGIVVMNADGSGELLIRECPTWWCQNPVWSPDGSRIAFLYMGTGWQNVWTIDKDGSDPVQLTDWDGDDGPPEWSPDGSKLAFHRVESRIAIYTVDADGANLTLLGPTAEDAAMPVWSPDGTRIAFQRDNGLSWNIALMDADGTNIQDVTAPSPEFTDGIPDWSPDGSTIAFERFSADGWRVYSVKPDGTDLVNLTSALASAGEPSWSPDGTRVAFHGSSSGPIYTMNADGSDVIDISQSGTQPDWGP